MDGRWPQDPSDFESTSRTMTGECMRLVHRLLSLLESKACPHLPAGTLANAHTLWGSEGQCTLRYLHYPPMDVSTLRKLTTAGEQFESRASAPVL